MQQLYIYPQPPDARPDGNPWPQWPLILRTYPAHDEGGSREFGLMVTRFEGENGGMQRVHAARVETRRENGTRTFVAVPGKDVHLDADLVLIAIGYEGAMRSPLLDELSVTFDAPREYRRRRGVRLCHTRCVRCRGCGAGCVADRLGDRGRTCCGAQLRRVPDGIRSAPVERCMRATVVG